MLKLVEINDSQFANLVLKSSLPVLVECASPECIICKTMADRIQEASKDFLSRMVFFRMDINDNKKWQEYSVRVIPTLLYFKGGALAGRQDNFPEVEDIRGQIKLMLKGGAGSPALSSHEEELRKAIDLEHVAAKLYRHISLNAKNGRVKECFKAIQQESTMHKEYLMLRLQEAEGSSAAAGPSGRLDGADFKPQGFSLMGGMKMALKIEERLLVFYKKAVKGGFFDDAATLKKIAKEAAAHLKALAKEMRFTQNKELFSAMESPDYPNWLQKVFE
jgi:thioredoxin 1